MITCYRREGEKKEDKRGGYLGNQSHTLKPMYL